MYCNHIVRVNGTIWSRSEDETLQVVWGLCMADALAWAEEELPGDCEFYNLPADYFTSVEHTEEEDEQYWYIVDQYAGDLYAAGEYSVVALSQLAELRRECYIFNRDGIEI